MLPPRKHLHVNFKMPPMDPTATGQLRNLPSRHNATQLTPIQQSALARRCYNSAAVSLIPDLDDDYPLASYRNQEIHQ